MCCLAKKDTQQSEQAGLDLAIALHQAATQPTVIVDKRLLVLWCNDSAAAMHPCLQTPDGLDQWLAGRHESIVQRLMKGEAVDFPVVGIGGSHLTLRFLPYLIERTLAFTLCIFDHSPYQGNALTLEVSQPAVEVLINTLNIQVRDPVHIIFSIVSLLAQTPKFMEDPKSEQMLGNIRKNCYKLLRSCMNLTELTRFQSGLAVLSPRYTECSSFFRSLLDACSMIVKTLDIPFTYHLPDTPLYTLLDPEKITTAFLHIILNACRFTREGNQISVTLTSTDSHVVVSVRDRGCGIPSQYLSRVFDPYFAYDPDGEVYANAGIGLSLTKLIIAAHGGTVTIDSLELEGTTVTFSLPLQEAGEFPTYVQSTPLDYLQNKFSPINVIFSDFIDYRS